jgi:hypothetical protein
LRPDFPVERVVLLGAREPGFLCREIRYATREDMLLIILEEAPPEAPGSGCAAVLPATPGVVEIVTP